MVERFREKLPTSRCPIASRAWWPTSRAARAASAVGTAHEDAKDVFARPAMQDTAQDAIALDRDAPKAAARAAPRGARGARP